MQCFEMKAERMKLVIYMTFNIQVTNKQITISLETRGQAWIIAT